MINRSTLKAALTPKPGCLSAHELEAVLENPSVEHPHLATCARCQAELTMLNDFEASAPLPDEGAAVAWISSEMERRLAQIKHPGSVPQRSSSPQATSWFTRIFGTGNMRWLVPVTATALIAVSVVVLRSRKEPELQANLGSGPSIYRSQQVDLVAPVGELNSAPKDLQWKAFGNAAKYKVAVMEVDHELLWSSETNYTIVTIPRDTRDKMLPGKPVLWQVTALDHEGRMLAVSQVQRFSVARKSPSSSSGLSPR
jgi:hypothetical protein